MYYDVHIIIIMCACIVVVGVPHVMRTSHDDGRAREQAKRDTMYLRLADERGEPYITTRGARVLLLLCHESTRPNTIVGDGPGEHAAVH